MRPRECCQKQFFQFQSRQHALSMSIPVMVGTILTPVASPEQVVETTIARGDLQEDMQQHHLRVESRLAEEWTWYIEGFTGLTRPKDMKGEYNLWVRYNYKRVVAAIDAEDQAGLLSPIP